MASLVDVNPFLIYMLVFVVETRVDDPFANKMKSKTGGKLALYATLLLVGALILSQGMARYELQRNLNQAAFRGDIGGVRRWIMLGGDPNSRDLSHKSAFDYAMEGFIKRNGYVPTSGYHPELDAIEGALRRPPRSEK